MNTIITSKRLFDEFIPKPPKNWKQVTSTWYSITIDKYGNTVVKPAEAEKSCKHINDGYTEHRRIVRE